MPRRRRIAVVDVEHAQRAGIGQFAGAIDPNDPTHAVVAQLRDTLVGDALRLVPQMAARGRTLYATSLTPQRFVRVTPQPNSGAALATLSTMPIKRNQSRALGQFRGTPT